MDSGRNSNRFHCSALVILAFMIWSPQLKAQVIKSTAVTIDFFSETPLEDISATSSEGVAVLNAISNEVAFQVPIKSFQFKRALMQEHFNENYMESGRYPMADFKGKITTPVNWTSNGTYPVEAKGVLNIHHVEKERTIKATVIINGKDITIKSQFDVACKDHGIDIPSILFKKIAEVINVNVSTIFNQK